jgi:hypothetical protein
VEKQLGQVADAAHLEKRDAVDRADVRGGSALHRLAEGIEPAIQLIANGGDAGYLCQRQEPSDARDRASPNRGRPRDQIGIARELVEARQHLEFARKGEK